MAQIYVMGMIFDENNVPDFGSIRCTDLRGGANFKGKNQYILKSTDVSKLDLITNASDGSTAICTDTADLYILHMDEWVKFGEENEGPDQRWDPIRQQRCRGYRPWSLRVQRE